MIKGTIKENLNLLGNVNINIKSKSTVVDKINVHNSSTIDLCRFVRSALCGRSKIDKLPGKIIPCRASVETEESSNITLIPLLTTGIEASMPVEDDDTEDISYALIPFLIPNTMISSGTKIRGFKLMSYDDVEYATIKLAKAQEILVEADTNIEVEWKLIIRPIED